MVAGTRTSRTMVASTKIAVARPSPIILMPGSSPRMKPQKTATMISAAEVMIRPVPAMPRTTALVVVAGAQVLLANPRQQEHLVVHGQPEQDREHEHRDEREDRHGRLQADQVRAPAPLEDHHQHAVRRSDAEQVHHCRLERHQHRPEHHEQQQERRGHDGGDERRQPVLDPVTRGRRTSRPGRRRARAPGALPSTVGNTSDRSRSMVSLVATSCGDVVGCATRVATPASGRRAAVATDAMPGSAATAAASGSSTLASPARCRRR